MADPEFYIYALFRETGVPFYIGKGKRYRWRITSYDKHRNHHKLAIIARMKAAGLTIPTVILHDGLTEDIAFTYERALIAAIGRSDLGCGPLVNLTNGGEGSSGRIVTSEARAHVSMRHRGKKLSLEHAAKLKASNIGRKLSEEHRTKLIAARHSSPASPATRAKLSAANLGRIPPPDAIAKTAAANRGKKRSPETRAKMVEAARNRSPEMLAQIIAASSAANRGKVLSPETRAKIAAKRLGTTLSPEHRAKISAGLQGQKRGAPSAETRAKIGAANRAAHLRRLAKAPVNDGSQHLIPGL